MARRMVKRQGLFGGDPGILEMMGVGRWDGAVDGSIEGRAWLGGGESMAWRRQKHGFIELLNEENGLVERMI
jgi:hypothetical protein